jgi:5-methylcytosine-specific restriction endonuclease McrA
VNRFSLTHLSNEVLRRELTTKAARENEATAELLAHIAEFDERKLYLPEAYESMLAYCTGELQLSEDAAKKRIQVARVGRTCPAVFEALESGRVHLTGLRVLAPHITPGTVEELLAAATHKTKEAIEGLLAERSPRLGVPAMVTPMCEEGAPGHLRNTDPQGVTVGNSPLATSGDRVTPLSTESFAVQFTRSREADERFRYAQTLLGHQVRPSDIAEVYDRAIKVLVEKLERRRFGACAKPRKGGRRTRSGSRHVSLAVRRAVWERDQGQCTFKSESGRRCEARRGLQFDHEKEFARGGEATIENIRLRCPGHNQYSAERTFGAGFMRQKREEAAAARAARKQAARATGEDRSVDPSDDDVLSALRTLGYRDGESRRALELCADMAGASAETKLRRALTYFPLRCHNSARPTAASATGTRPS